MRLGIVAAIVVWLCSGCAFKSPAGGEAGDTLYPNDEALTGIQLGWDGLEHPLEVGANDFSKRDARTWTHELPLSIPAALPKSISMSIGIRQDAQALQGVDVAAQAVNGEGIRPKDLGVSDLIVTPADTGSWVNFHVQAIPLLFSSEREQRVYVTLKLSQAHRPLANIRLLLITPPSALTELERSSKPAMLPTILKTQATEIQLVERAIFRNDSWAPVSISFPFSVSGRVAARFKRFTIDSTSQPNPHVQAHEQGVTPETKEKETALFIVPAISGIEQSWTQLPEGGVRKVVVAQGSILEIGLYVPSEVSAFLKPLRGIEPESLTASIDARARCPNWVPPTIPASVNGDEGRSYCQMLRDSGHYDYSDEAIQACTDSIRSMRACLASGWAKEPCDQAALTDDHVDQTRAPHPDSHVPWPSWMGCRRFDTTDGHTTYIYNGWVWEPINGTFLEGLEWQEATLHAPSFNIEGILRFDIDTQGTNAEGRTLALFKDGIVLR